ncbi:phthiocerol/phthiodiolone dimycocerosyl transferase family protein [Deminuibacter soli]|uniref:Phthiocerol/phthiodiolone dimycocerosyl transferase n=1 Tax=Deminuibacter soli TaxID=2291815 RepID=A0A3E1NM61_9BACT|nr:condensation domain-containing protein [Deminuibacter soli]RFM29026.1 condensation protein [Deminuibacter soli]
MNTHQHRTLGAFEKAFWLLDQVDSKDFALAAEVEGTATAGEWQAAVNALQQRHPNLCVRITVDAYNRPVFTPVPGKAIPFRVVDAAEHYRWEQEVETELATRFNTAEGPLLRAVIVRKPAGTVIILVSHHAIADGTSLAYLMRDVLQAVTGKTLSAMPAAVSNDELLGMPEDSVGDIAKQALVFETPVAVVPHVDKIQLSQQLTEKLVKRSREEATTVHGALCAAVLMAGRKLDNTWKDERIEMISPVCARRALKIGDECNLNITTHPVYFEPGQVMSFWELARFAKAGLEGVRSVEHVRGYLNFFRELTFNGKDIATMLEPMKAAFNHQVMITNLGRIKYDTDFGAMQLKALWGPMVLSGKGKEQTIGANASNGSICLTNTSQTPLPSLFKLVEQLLEVACDVPVLGTVL